MKILRLGEMLVQNDVLTQEELDDALSKQRGSGKRLGTVLIDEGYITEKQLITTLKTQLGIDEVDLNEMTIPPEMATYIPKSVAVNNRIVPVKLEGDRLFIAMEDPLNFRAIEEAKEVSRKKITPMITYSAMITRALSVVYENEGAANAIKEMREERGLTIGEMAAEQEAQDENAAAPTVKLVNSILERAITDKASDIHIEPTNGKMRIRIRVDGRLVEIPIDIPKEFQSNVISRIKVMGYAQAGYTATFQENGRNTNTFDMKRVVMMLGADIAPHFYAFIMHEFKAGNLLEYYMEYRPSKAINFRLGQSKTEISMTNPLSPRIFESINCAPMGISWLCGSDPLLCGKTFRR